MGVCVAHRVGGRRSVRPRPQKDALAKLRKRLYPRAMTLVTAIEAVKKTIPVAAPATGEPLGEVPVMDATEVRRTVERARIAQRAWAVLSVEERAERLLSF